jgi:hypothetical protein
MKPALDAAAGTIELDLGHAYSTAIGARLRDASGPQRSGGFSVQFDVSYLARIPDAQYWRAFLARIGGVCGSLDFGSRAAP